MGRICSVTGCSNSTARLAKWMKIKCGIHERYFGSCYCKPPFVLFPFPTESKGLAARRRWVKAINRKTPSGANWHPSEDGRVCSVHFKDGEPTEQNPDPTEELGYNLLPCQKQQSPREPVYQRVAKRSQDMTNKSPQPLEAKLYEPGHDHSYSYHCDCSKNCFCPGCLSHHKKNMELKFENQSLQEQVTCQKKKFEAAHSSNSDDGSFVLKNDESVQKFLGLPSKVAFEKLHQHLAKKAPKMKYWEGSSRTPPLNGKPDCRKASPKKTGQQRKLCTKTELVIVLMKLRLALTMFFFSFHVWDFYITCVKNL